MTAARELRPGDHLVLEVTASTVDPLDAGRMLVVIAVPGQGRRTAHLSLDTDADVPTDLLS